MQWPIYTFKNEIKKYNKNRDIVSNQPGKLYGDVLLYISSVVSALKTQSPTILLDTVVLRRAS